MVWIVAAIVFFIIVLFLSQLFSVFPKETTVTIFAIIAFVIVVGSVLLLTSLVRDRDVANVTASVSYYPTKKTKPEAEDAVIGNSQGAELGIMCSQEQPLSLSVENKTDKTIKSSSFVIKVKRSGYSRDVYTQTIFTDKVISPRSKVDLCFPLTHYGASELKSEPENLDWSVLIQSVNFYK